MPRVSNSEKLRRIHENAMMEFGNIQAVMRDERNQCLQDRRFVHVPGAQWEGRLGEQFQNKPRLEVNKVAMAVDQIVTDYRNSRIDASFVSKDGALDTDLADTCAALHRADVQDSDAEEAYSNAFEEAVSGGFGAWRLRTRYEDPDVDDEYEEDEDRPDEPQRIQFEPIYDADRFVFFDLNARKHDKSDARSCYILTPFTRDAYEREYPDSDVSTWPQIIHQHEFDWATPDIIYTAEVFLVEYQKDSVCSYYVMITGAPGSNGGALGVSSDLEEADIETHWRSELDEDPDIEKNLRALGYKKLSEKKVKRKRIHKYIMNGMEILEDCGYIVGREIPVVPVYAKRFYIDNVERCRGHVRLARDAQMIKNMLLSKLAEISALSSVEKPYMTPEQSAGFEEIYAGDNIENRAYLPINPITNAEGQQESIGPVAWTKVPNVPPATAALHQQVDTDMKEILGNPDQGEKVVSHVSGKSVQAVQRRVDSKSSLYLSNMGKAMRWSGKIWLGMAPEVYNKEGRKMKGVGPKGELTRVELKKPIVDKDQKLKTANDLSRAKLDVAVSVGPSSDSKREAAVEAGINMLAVTEDPETKAVITLHILMNMTGEGTDDMREWARRNLVEKGVLKPTPEEAEAMAQAKQNQEPTPIDKLALAQAEEAMAKVRNAAAQQALTLARTDQTKADTMATLADIDLKGQTAQADAVKSLHDMQMAAAAARTEAVTAQAEAAAAQSSSGEGAPPGSLGSS